MTSSTLHPAFDSVPVPLFTLRERRVAYANPALAALLGVAAAELAGRAAQEMLEPFLVVEDAGWTRALDDRTSAVPTWVGVRCADGSTRMMCLRKSVGPDGTLLVAVVDAEAEFEALNLTNALARGARQLLVLRDEDEVLERASDVMQAVGLSSLIILDGGDRFIHGPVRHDPATVAAVEKMHGRPLRGLELPKALAPGLVQILESPRAIYRQDAHRMVDALNPPEIAAVIKKTFPRISCDAPIRVENRSYGLLSVQGDHLSPVGAGAVELFALQVGAAVENARHHRRAAERLRELEQMQTELVTRERLAAVGEAAAVLAHEIRNPLGVLLNAAAVLTRDAALGGDSATVVQTVEEETLRLDRLVNDLLAFVRPLSPRPRTVQLEEQVRRAVTRVEPDLAGLTVLVEGKAPVPAHADPDLLLLVVENLVRNAAQASPRGGRIRVLVEPVERGARVAVEDEGPGVPEVDREKIFQPFFTTRARGTGLGLALARRIAVAHGGTLSVTDAPRRGARFELVLPAP